MKYLACILALLSSPAFAASPSPVPGGEIDTLEQGRYSCELPGDATGPAGRRVADADFTVISASSYRAKGTLGSYLLTGNNVIMTNGTHRGQKFHRVSRGFLRKINADGSDGMLRCVLGRRRASDSPDRCPDRPEREIAAFQPDALPPKKESRQAHCASRGRAHEHPDRQDPGEG